MISTGPLIERLMVFAEVWLGSYHGKKLHQSVLP